MLNENFKLILITLFIGNLFLNYSCKKKVPSSVEEIPTTVKVVISKVEKDTSLFKIILEKDMTIDEYFEYINGIIERYDSLVPYELTEYLLVHANDWLIDTFAHSDYYFQMKKGNFIYNQKSHIVLKKLDTLYIPNEKLADSIQQRISSFWIDINIPEYKLWLYEGDSILFTFPIRVGQVGKRFMSTVNREVDMKTKTGIGHIAKINHNPRWQNPVNAHEYKTTLRDDLNRTLVPRIPFLNPEINGKRWGQLIHPTTNPETLGKAYSNGCIGTSEGDAWRIYFHAPISTKVNIRYDLEIKKNDVTFRLRDIYGYAKK